jgi:hypothetical protein
MCLGYGGEDQDYESETSGAAAASPLLVRPASAKNYPKIGAKVPPEEWTCYYGMRKHCRVLGVVLRMLNGKRPLNRPQNDQTWIGGRSRVSERTKRRNAEAIKNAAVQHNLLLRKTSCTLTEALRKIRRRSDTLKLYGGTLLPPIMAITPIENRRCLGPVEDQAVKICSIFHERRLCAEPSRVDV